ncbi:hypothetical protein BDZ91DRAFT_760789 [Kalaharituber pfeilii]|nr:hypothetical protein BDZ91DRAFT_760789 [Kalaharituber pfeilii]
MTVERNANSLLESYSRRRPKIIHYFAVMEEARAERKRSRELNEHRTTRAVVNLHQYIVLATLHYILNCSVINALARDESGQPETITSTSSKDLWQFVPKPGSSSPLIPLGSFSAENAMKIKNAIEAKDVTSKEPYVTLQVLLSIVENPNVGKVQVEEYKRLLAENERLKLLVNTLRGTKELSKERMIEMKERMNAMDEAINQNSTVLEYRKLGKPASREVYLFDRGTLEQSNDSNSIPAETVGGRKIGFNEIIKVKFEYL